MQRAKRAEKFYPRDLREFFKKIKNSLKNKISISVNPPREAISKDRERRQFLTSQKSLSDHKTKKKFKKKFLELSREKRISLRKILRNFRPEKNRRLSRKNEI